MTAVMDILGEQLTIGEEAAEVRSARHKIREFVAAELDDTDLVDRVELMASEAITNAHLHGAAPITATVAIVADERTKEKRLRVEVRDQGPGSGKPVRNGRVDNGRGLDLIAALSSRWHMKLDLLETLLWFEVDL